MKTTVRIFTIVSMLTLIMSITTMSCGAASSLPSSSMDQDVIIYGPEQDAILKKIEELGIAKAKINHYINSHGLTYELFAQMIESVPELKVLVNETNALRTELISMNAKPSAEMLSELTISSPIEVNDSLIEDFADFEYTFGDVFDIWGISGQVTIENVTYQTYEIIIQDFEGNNILSTYAMQNNATGVEIFIQGTPIYEAVANNIIGTAVDGIIKHIYEELPVFEHIVNGYELITNIMEIDDETADMMTGTGHSKSYRIYCDAIPSVHFVYVKASTANAWRHMWTTNLVNTVEVHHWYMVVNGGGVPVPYSDEKTYTHTIVNDQYKNRLTYAISRYRNNQQLGINNNVEYTIVANVDGVEYDIFDLAITCPEDFDDLVRYGVQ